MKSTIFAGVLLLIATATAATAQPIPPQDQMPSFCPSGDVTTVRVSKLKQGGSLDGFHKAFEDHKKWYFDHGYARDRFRWGRGLTFDPATKTISQSPDTVITFHFVTSQVPDDKKDAAWKAYVAEYDQNSEIVSTTILCLEP